eukprot:3524942-Prymnesium_polylepis.1
MFSRAARSRRISVFENVCERARGGWQANAGARARLRAQGRAHFLAAAAVHSPVGRLWLLQRFPHRHMGAAAAHLESDSVKV